MSQLSRILSLGSRLCSRLSPIAARARPAAIIQQPPLRYTARIATSVNEAIPRRLPLDDAVQLKEVLRQLNEQVQRIGRVSSGTVEEAISIAEKMGSVSGVETQILLRATGSFLRDQRPSEREKLTERVWKLAPKDRLDISHFNVLLHVKLENGTEFDPSSFLQELSDAKVAPNRVTYQRLVQRYCEMGDIQNAVKIIEFMKSQNVAITEKLFHSLIVGHLRTGDPEAARKILDVMQNAALKPTPETYTVLAEGLAEMGDSKGALEILSEGQFLDEQILRIVKALAVRGDVDAAQQAMTPLSDATINYSSVNGLCLELLVMGKPDIAIEIYKACSSKSRRRDADFLVACAARNGYSASETLRIHEALKTPEVGHNAFVEATRIVVESGNRALSEDYINTMRNLGLPIRAHYFLPFLCTMTDEAGVFSELEKISSLETPTFELIRQFVLPRVDTSDFEKVHAKLVEAGVPSNVAANALVREYLIKDRLADAEKVLLNFEVSKVSGLASYTAIAMNRSRDTATAVRILQLLAQSGDPKSEMVAKFIEASGQLVNEGIEAISKTDLTISLKSFNRLSAAGIKMEPLSKQVVTVSETHRMDDRDFDRPTVELEALLVEAEAGNEDTSRLLKVLLNRYYRANKAEKIEEVLRKLPVLSLSGANLSNLVDFFTTQQDSERAMYYVDQALDRNIIINPYRVLGLAKLFVSQKRLFEAAELLDKTSPNFSLSIENLPIDIAAGSLLSHIYENYGKDATLNFHDRYISKHSNARVLGVMLRSAIDTDIVEAFELFKDIVQKYGKAPCRKHFCRKFIEQNMTEELETMQQILEKLMGRATYASDMVVCYLDLNKQDKAREMMRTCFGHRGAAYLRVACNDYFEKGDGEKLHELLGLMEEFGTDNESSYLYRIKQYDKENDFAAALDVWTAAQERGIILQPAALEILAQLLERNGQPVPFVIPEQANDLIRGTGRAAFQDIVNRSLEEALEFREKIKAENGKLKRSDLFYLLERLIENDRIKEGFDVVGDIDQVRGLSSKQDKVLGNLFAAGARNGMIDELEAFTNLRGGLGVEALQEAYFNAGRLEEYLTKLESEPLNRTRFFILKEVMDSDPAIAARFEKLAHRKATEGGSTRLVAELWYLHIINSEVDKAVELEKRYPQIIETLTTTRASRSLRKHLDRNFFERLLKVTDNPGIRSKALETVLLGLLRRGDSAEAKACFDAGSSLGIDINPASGWIMQRFSKSSSESGSDVASERQSSREEVEARMA